MAGPMKQVKRLAETLGADVESDSSGNWYDIFVEAPEGMTFDANGLHCLSGGCYLGDASWQVNAWADILERMKYGISPCENEDCDTCNGY